MPGVVQLNGVCLYRHTPLECDMFPAEAHFLCSIMMENSLRFQVGDTKILVLTIHRNTKQNKSPYQNLQEKI